MIGVLGAEGLNVQGGVPLAKSKAGFASVLNTGIGKIKRAAQDLGKKGPSPFATFRLRSNPIPQGDSILGESNRPPLVTRICMAGTGRAGIRRAGSKGQGMQDITALEQRITAALERIGKGVDRLATTPRLAAPAPTAPIVASGPSGAEVALRTELDEVKAQNAQLRERVRVLKDREPKGDLQDKVDRLTQQLDVQGLELQRMRRTASALRDQIAALRAAQETGVTEPQLINKALVAELDALRAIRLTEVAEMDEILAALEPHLTEAGHA